MYNGIALCGKAGSGKDSVLQALCELSDDYSRVAFADGVKELAKQITGVNFFDEEVKAEPKNRQFLQFLGTDLMRERWQKDWWVRVAESKAKALIRDGKLPVFTDARFPDEADVGRALGMLVVRLEATPETLEARGRPMTDHPSETALDAYTEYDIVIETDYLTPVDIAENLHKLFISKVLS